MNARANELTVDRVTKPDATDVARSVDAPEIDAVAAGEYASLIGGDPVAYRERHEVHPLYLTVLVLRAIFRLAAEPTMSWTMESVLHAKQSFSFRAPLTPGPVSVETAVAPAVRYGLGAAIPITCDVGRAGMPLASSAALLAVSTYTGPTSTAPPDEPSTRRLDRLATRVLTVDADFVDRYAAVSGDRNPIHLDDSAAQRAGLQGRIVHGTAILALGTQLGLDAVGIPRAGRLTEVHARFSGLVPVGSEVTIEAWSTTRPSQVALTAEVNGKRVLREAWLSIETPQ